MEVSATDTEKYRPNVDLRRYLDISETEYRDLIRSCISTEGNPVRTAALDVLTNDLVSTFAPRFESRRITVHIPEGLTNLQERTLVDSYKSFNIKFTQRTVNAHAFAAASRRLELAELLDRIGYYEMTANNVTPKMIGTDDLVCDIGGNWYKHYALDNKHVHSCSPLLNRTDEVRYSDRVSRFNMEAIKMKGLGVNVRLNYFESLKELVDIHLDLVRTQHDINNIESNKLFCSRRAQYCNRTANYAILLHSCYDIPLCHLGDALDNKGVKVAYGCFVWSPDILLHNTGYIDKIDQYYEVDAANDSITFSFVDDSSHTYKHTLSIYLSYVLVSNFMNTAGTARFTIELLENRCGIQFFKISKVLVPSIITSPLRHRVWFPGSRSKVVLRYYDLDEKKLLTKRLLGWGGADLNALLIPKFFVVDKELVNRAIEQAFSTPEDRFRCVEIFSYLRSFNRRIIFGGTNVLTKTDTVDADTLYDLAAVIYLYVYIRRYNVGKVNQLLINEIKFDRELLGKNLFAKIFCSRTDVFGIEGYGALWPLHSWIYRIRRMSDNMKKFVLEHIKFISLENFSKSKPLRVHVSDTDPRLKQYSLWFKDKKVSYLNNKVSVFSVDDAVFTTTYLDRHRLLTDVLDKNFSYAEGNVDKYSSKRYDYIKKLACNDRPTKQLTICENIKNFIFNNRANADKKEFDNEIKTKYNHKDDLISYHYLTEATYTTDEIKIVGLETAKYNYTTLSRCSFTDSSVVASHSVSVKSHYTDCSGTDVSDDESSIGTVVTSDSEFISATNSPKSSTTHSVSGDYYPAVDDNFNFNNSDTETLTKLSSQDTNSDCSEFKGKYNCSLSAATNDLDDDIGVMNITVVNGIIEAADVLCHMIHANRKGYAGFAHLVANDVVHYHNIIHNDISSKGIRYGGYVITYGNKFKKIINVFSEKERLIYVDLEKALTDYDKSIDKTEVIHCPLIGAGLWERGISEAIKALSMMVNNFKNIKLKVYIPDKSDYLIALSAINRIVRIKNNELESRYSGSDSELSVLTDVIDKSDVIVGDMEIKFGMRLPVVRLEDMLKNVDRTGLPYWNVTQPNVSTSIDSYNESYSKDIIVCVAANRNRDLFDKELNRIYIKRKTVLEGLSYVLDTILFSAYSGNFCIYLLGKDYVLEFSKLIKVYMARIGDSSSKVNVILRPRDYCNYSNELSYKTCDCTRNTGKLIVKKVPGDGRCLFYSLNRANIDIECMINNLIKFLCDSSDDDLAANFINREEVMEELNGDIWGSLQSINLFVMCYDINVCIHNEQNREYYLIRSKYVGSETIHLVYYGNHYDYLDLVIGSDCKYKEHGGYTTKLDYVINPTEENLLRRYSYSLADRSNKSDVAGIHKRLSEVLNGLYDADDATKRSYNLINIYGFDKYVCGECLCKIICGLTCSNDRELDTYFYLDLTHVDIINLFLALNECLNIELLKLGSLVDNNYLIVKINNSNVQKNLSKLSFEKFLTNVNNMLIHTRCCADCKSCTANNFKRLCDRTFVLCHGDYNAKDVIIRCVNVYNSRLVTDVIEFHGVNSDLYNSANKFQTTHERGFNIINFPTDSNGEFLENFDCDYWDDVRSHITNNIICDTDRGSNLGVNIINGTIRNVIQYFGGITDKIYIHNKSCVVGTNTDDPEFVRNTAFVVDEAFIDYAPLHSPGSKVLHHKVANSINEVRSLWAAEKKIALDSIARTYQEVEQLITSMGGIGSRNISNILVTDPTFALIDVAAKCYIIRPKVPIRFVTSFNVYDGFNLVNIVVNKDNNNDIFNCDYSKCRNRFVGINKLCIYNNTDKMHKATMKIRNLESINNVKVTLRLGVPGSGKTAYVIDNVKFNNNSRMSDMIITATRETAADIKHKLKIKRDVDDGILQQYVKTGDSYLINSHIKCKRLWVDEGLMKHAGEIFLSILKSGCSEVIILGDLAQIPYINRLPQFQVCYAAINDFGFEIDMIKVSHRCPRDVVCLMNVYKLYPFDVKTDNFCSDTMHLARISNINEVPREEDCVYLTMTQAEKANLITAGFKLVFTVHEYQGKQSDRIRLVRENPKPNGIYRSINHILVAISRHIKFFTYHTVVVDDTISAMISKKYTSAELRSVNALPNLMRGGGIRKTVDIIETIGVQTAEFERVYVPSYHNDKPIANHKLAYEIASFFGCGDLNSSTVARIALSDMTTSLDYYNQGSASHYSVIQDYYDNMFPQESTEFRLNDQALFEYGEYVASPKNMSIGLYKGYLNKPFVNLMPVIRTSYPIQFECTQQYLIKAFLDRNGNVPDYMGVFNVHEVAVSVVDNFVNTFVDDTGIFENFEKEPIDLSATSIAMWMQKTDEHVIKSVEADKYKFFDLDLRYYHYIVKHIAKANLEGIGSKKIISPQTIAFHDKIVNCIFCPIMRECLNRLLGVLKSNFVINTNMSTLDFQQLLNGRFPPGVIETKFGNWLEVDMSKFDKSQYKLPYEIEMLILTKLGFPKWLLPYWAYCHYLTVLTNRQLEFRAEVYFQRKSGDAATFFGNTLILMSVLAYKYDLTNSVGLFAGDDSFLFSDSKLDKRNDAEFFATMFNFESKLLNYKVPYFCSKFLLPIDQDHWAIVPDLAKLITKLGNYSMRNYEHVEELRISFLDNYNIYNNAAINHYLSRAMADRYGINLSVDCVLATICRYFNNSSLFASLFVEHENYREYQSKIKVKQILPRLDI